MIKPKFAIPLHYGANPPGKGTPQQCIEAPGAAPVKVSPLNPGDAVVYAARPKADLLSLPAQLNVDGENYLPNAAAAVCEISTSLIPAPLTPTAPTISPSEKIGKPPGIVTKDPAPAASVMASAW